MQFRMAILRGEGISQQLSIRAKLWTLFDQGSSIFPGSWVCQVANFLLEIANRLERRITTCRPVR